ncbi:hypothetical protein [Nocardia sp. NBC_01009]|uniref:hypothetical protein n=1 Tax=Nocardia sp. NBC_01009 TaxID=2975996 RepID=UPI00386DE47F|nr:hypothetical protein OHA42_26435 [Nocardia sp. NBC_01009]
MKILVVGPGGREHAIAKALWRELGSARCYFSLDTCCAVRLLQQSAKTQRGKTSMEGSGMQSFKDNTVAWLPVIETVSS